MSSRFTIPARSLFFVLAVFCGASPVPAAEPIEKTPYGRAGLRIEARLPTWDAPPPIEKFEPAMAKAGVQARWIEVVDFRGNAMVENPYLPCPYSPEIAKKHEAFLTRWVDEIHRSGMAAMSWYPLIFSEQANKLHPDWRQVAILPWAKPSDETLTCCFNSPYGDALINYCNWAIERFKLDGIWFDGATWTLIWVPPYPLSCRCAACLKKFKAETGQEIPQTIDWGAPTFRKWVAWRYKEFGGYIGRMSKAIRDKHPRAVVSINHLHRPEVSWQSAIPLDKYAADIICGSEAITAESVDLTMRLCRAYGRAQSEVWKPFDVGPNAQTGVEPLLEHALVCYVVGGYPSYGYNPFAGQDENAIAAAGMMTPILDAIRPYVGGTSLPYCALHVSQQSETFFFGPAQDRARPRDPYFASLANWTTSFGETHMPPDYVFDADFKPDVLARYKLLLMPLSMAINDAQAATAIEYVRSGGTLLLGPGAGQCDAEGVPRAKNPLAEAFGFSFAQSIAPTVEKPELLRLVDAAGRQRTVGPDRHTTLKLTGAGWDLLYREGDGADATPAIAMRPFGRGRVMVVSFDAVQSLEGIPLSGGDTKLDVVSETAASGKYSLKFVDGPSAPQSCYPDLEARILPFGAPDYVGGTLQYDMKVDPKAMVVVEVRSSDAPGDSPRVIIQPNGSVSIPNHVLGNVPCGQWFHVVVSYDFAQEQKPATYQVTIALPGGKNLQSPRIAMPAAAYRRSDWLVVYGPGAAPSTFYLDNLTLSARKANGPQVLVYREDFEAGADALDSAGVVMHLAKMLGDIVAPPIGVRAPKDVRVGFFEADGNRVLVHLHRRSGKRLDWQQPSGPEIVLRGRLPIRAAKLAIDNRPLAIRREGDSWEITVPPIGLYQVIELESESSR